MRQGRQLNEVDTIIDRLLKSKTDEDREDLLSDFKHLSSTKKGMAEGRLIQLLNDTQMDGVPRSWITTMLGLVGTPGAKESLMHQLRVEKIELVRRWAGLNLVRFFDGDEIVALVGEQIDRDLAISDRRFYARALAQSSRPSAFLKLETLLDDREPDVRYYAIYGIRQSPQKTKALQLLLERLDKERDLGLMVFIVEVLGEIGDPKAIPSLISTMHLELQRVKILDDTPSFLPFSVSLDVQIAAMRALLKVATADNEEVVQAFLEIACGDDPVLSFAATKALMDFLSPDNAARLLADFGLQHTDSKALPRVADALRFIPGTAAIEYLGGIQGERAERLLEEIGRRPAMDVLLRRRVETLTEARDRVKEFDKQGLTIFQDTISQAKRGFTMSLWMSGAIFVIGLILLMLSIRFVALRDASQFQRLYGVGGGVVGLGTVLTMFYRGPLERIEQAVAHLVQTEIAFLVFIRQVTQVNAMFEREYVDSEKFGVAELNSLLQYTERIMKETMPLVRRYTLSPPDEEVNDEK